MTRGHTEEQARLAREVAARAVRRLDVLEWVTLSVVGLLSMGGGALVAALLGEALGTAFRPTWVVASLLLFGVPGVIALRRMRADERETRAKIQELLEENDG